MLGEGDGALDGGKVGRGVIDGAGVIVGSGVGLRKQTSSWASVQSPGSMSTQASALVAPQQENIA